MRIILIIAFMFIFTSFCFGRDLSIPMAKITGAKVETELIAKRLAFDSYIKRMDGNISATETVRDISVQVLGYSISEFADKGVQLWEARVVDKQELRATIWINPYSEQVHFVCGPWDSYATKEPD